MRKLAWLALILLIGSVVFITLGLTDFAGIGTTTGGFLHNSILAPVRNFIVDGWLFIGTSGWYILAAVVGIGMFWIPFYFLVIKGLFWDRLIQQKLLHNTPQTTPLYQSAPAAAVPITGLQSAPAQSAPQAASTSAAVPPEPEKETTS